MIHIILCTDENYVMPCGITIFSICYNNKCNHLFFHILTEGVSSSKKAEIKYLVETYGQKIDFYDVNSSLLGNVPVNNRFRISIYYRLLMANILPKNISKILYLDSDIIVRGNLQEIWEIDITDKALGAVLDQSCDDIRNYNRTNLLPLCGYYNSGVLLINLDYWRKAKIGEACIQYVNENCDKVIYPDQDALNVVTQKLWAKLSFKYNVQAHMYHKANEILARTNYIDEMMTASQTPFILHCTEALKPWMIGCRHPFTTEYIKYKNMSPWRNTPLVIKKNIGKVDSILTIIKKLCIKIRIAKPALIYSPYRSFNHDTLPEYQR